MSDFTINLARSDVLFLDAIFQQSRHNIGLQAALAQIRDDRLDLLARFLSEQVEGESTPLDPSMAETAFDFLSLAVDHFTGERQNEIRRLVGTLEGQGLRSRLAVVVHEDTGVAIERRFGSVAGVPEAGETDPDAAALIESLGYFVPEEDWNEVVVNRERLTLRDHTLLVLRQFERYHAGFQFPAPLDRAFFRLFLAIHDAGKARSVRELRLQKKKGGADHKERKELEHRYTSEIISKVLTDLGYSQRHRDIVLAVLGSQLGSFLQPISWTTKLIRYHNDLDAKGPDEPSYDGRGTNHHRIQALEGAVYDFFGKNDMGLADQLLAEVREKRSNELTVQVMMERTVPHMREMAKRAGMGIDDYFGLARLYNMVDAGSYTTDASGSPQIKGEFTSWSTFDEDFVFERERRRMDYSEPRRTHVENLRRALRDGVAGSGGPGGSGMTPDREVAVSGVRLVGGGPLVRLVGSDGEGGGAHEEEVREKGKKRARRGLPPQPFSGRVTALPLSGAPRPLLNFMR